MVNRKITSFTFPVLLTSIFLALTGCASKFVTEKTPPEKLGSQVGYVAFHYARENGESAEISVRHVVTGETYRFSLSRPVNSIYFAVGAYKAYEKALGGTEPVPLTLIPLPAGEYECRYVQLQVKQPAWRALLLQMPPAETSRSLKGKVFSVAADTVTYIGTYHTRAKAKFFGGIDYAVETLDDGDERAARIGIQGAFRKSLLALE